MAPRTKNYSQGAFITITFLLICQDVNKYFSAVTCRRTNPQDVLISALVIGLVIPSTYFFHV